MSEYENMPVEQIDSEIANLEGQLAARGVDVPTETKPAATKPVAEKPGLFEHGSDAKLTKKLEAVFDKSTARDDAILGAKEVPSAETDSFDEAFAASYDWLHAPEADKQVRRDADQAIDDMVKNADRIGLKMTREDAAQKLWERDHMHEAQDQANAAAEWSGAAEAIRQHYPNEKPADIARNYASMETRIRENPVQGFAEIAQRLGYHPAQVAQAMWQQFGGQHQQVAQYQQQQQQQNYQQGVAALTNLVEQHYQQFPRMAELEAEIVAELESTKRSGDPAKDLQNAYRRADSKNRKRSTSDRIDRSMNRTFDRMNKR